MNGASRTPSTLLPPPATHATCAWCRRNFATVVDLLQHVEGEHRPVRPG